MTNRACHKEEGCCRKARAAIETFEASTAKGNFDDNDSDNAWRKYIRDKIDAAATDIEQANLDYANSESGSFPPDHDDDDDDD